MSSSAHLIGQKVGEYDVIRRIGSGGMGAVYEGKHPLIGKRVAIKVLLPQFSEDQAQMTRFFAEARAVNEIRHRGIVDIFGMGQLPDGAHYMVMEFLEGTNFEQLLKVRKSLPPVEALGLLEEVLEAVAAAHQAQIVHRDLKPSNIFLVDFGRGRPFVKLLDFGVAKLSRDEGGERRAEATGIIGTPIYMAPEQVNGLRAGPEADIYALGVVLFELITGRPPFTAENPVEMMTRHLDAKPPKVSEIKPGVPAEVDRLVDRMLSKRPQDRPQDAEELRSEVARLRSRIDLPLRRGAPQQRPLEDDVGPTVVRVVRRGGDVSPTSSTVADITPVQNRIVGRVDPERTQVASMPMGPAPAQWSPATTLDSDPEFAARPTMVGNSPPIPSPMRVTAEQPMLDGESPVPTLPVTPFDGPMPNFDKQSSKKSNSQSSPTLGVTDGGDGPPVSAFGGEPSLTEYQGSPLAPERKSSSANRPAPVEARTSRVNESMGGDTLSAPTRPASEPRSKLVLIYGLAAAAGFVLVVIFLKILG
jgi:serine/threonine protein kinase